MTEQILLSYTQAGSQNETYALVWSPGGIHIASGGDEKVVRVWDASTGHSLMQYSGLGDIVFKIGWSPAGTRIGSASDNGTVQVWQLLTY